MDTQVVFRALAVPVSKKVLHAFRRDAGWPVGDSKALGGSENSHGKVQWVTAERGKKTIGIARLELAPPQFCYLSDLIISSAYRGQGVGNLFMKYIEQYCSQFGIPRVLLKAHEDTKGFYEKMNFVPDPNAATFLKKEINPFHRKILVR